MPGAGQSGKPAPRLCSTICRLIQLQSSNGEACTCVVTEYHYHNSIDFVIDVEFFSEDELIEQVTELFQSYRRYYLHPQDMWDEDERKASEERANVAWDTFQAMFRGRLEIEQFLRSEPQDSVLATLISWTQEMGRSPVGGRWTRTTLADCSDHLMQLTSNLSSAQEPAVWPYMRKIK